MTGIESALESVEAPLFVTHQQADRDSLGAAIGLQELLQRGTVCTPDGVTQSGRPLLEATGTESVTRAEDAMFDTVVVLDTPTRERIEPIAPNEVILIDHHEPDDLSDIASEALVDTDADATSVLVARLALRSSWQLSPDVALPLLVGIFGDTGNLTSATGETVRLTGNLIDSLAHRASELSDLINRTPDSSRRIARTLGMLRASGYRSGEWFVAFSEVGANESAAADALRHGGVDCTLIFSKRSDGYRITARASDSFVRQLSLGGSLLPSLADEFGGSGGGHDRAGGASLHSDDRAAIERYVLRQIEAQLDTAFDAISGD